MKVLKKLFVYDDSWVGNTEGTVTKPIVVSALTKDNVKHFAIGTGIILIGIGYLSTQCFLSGAKEFENKEYSALSDLGVV